MDNLNLHTRPGRDALREAIDALCNYCANGELTADRPTAAKLILITQASEKAAQIMSHPYAF